MLGLRARPQQPGPADLPAVRVDEGAAVSWAGQTLSLAPAVCAVNISSSVALSQCMGASAYCPAPSGGVEWGAEWPLLK